MSTPYEINEKAHAETVNEIRARLRTLDRNLRADTTTPARSREALMVLGYAKEASLSDVRGPAPAALARFTTALASGEFGAALRPLVARGREEAAQAAYEALLLLFREAREGQRSTWW